MAKKPVKAKSKAVVGSKKHKSFRLTPKRATFALVAILAFSVASGLGWQQWQDNRIEAQAKAWTNVSSISEGAMGGGTPPNLTITACKTLVNSKTFKVKVHFVKAKAEVKPTVRLGYYRDGIRTSSVITSSSWKNATTIDLTIQVKKTPLDKVIYGVSGASGGYESMFDPTKVVNC